MAGAEAGLAIRTRSREVQPRPQIRLFNLFGSQLTLTQILDIAIKGVVAMAREVRVGIELRVRFYAQVQRSAVSQDSSARRP